MATIVLCNRVTCMRSIVAYQSSDEGGEEEPTTEELVEKIDKRRSLPPLAQSFLPVVPVGDPALHQGRRRTTPHVEGQWVAHVYVPVRVEMWESLYSVMRDAGESASRLVKGLVLMGEDASKKEGMELHVSLTRPTYLRAHQREDLKRAIRSAALNHTA